MNRWHREIIQVVRDRGYVIVNWRKGGHHDVLHLHKPGCKPITISVSLSPRSIEQAAMNFKAHLKQLERRSNGS